MFKKKISLSPQLIILAFAAVLLVFSVLGDKGYVEYRLLLERERKIDERITRLENERLNWTEKIRSLHNDRSYYENIAREKLGYVRKNEILIELEHLK